ncbi:MAG: ferritin-like domain-containing protein, partial [Hymenobacter sp.]
VLADPTAAAFDYTGGKGSNAGPFADYRTNPDTYLKLAQSFEDTGVRAYKGAAPISSVMANKTVLTAALNIHSVEARHASHIRAMRRGGASSTNPSQAVAVSPYSAAPKSWISGTDGGGAVPGTTNAIYGAGNSSGAGTAANITYLAEDNNVQGGVTLTTTTSAAFSSFPTTAFTEAFDEGLDVGTVSTIARLFTVTGSTLF